MKASFVGQPFDEFGGSIGEWLEERLMDPDVRRLRIAVAWAKRSGVSLLGPALQSLKMRGGTASIIIGIDEGGATWQGFTETQQLFDSVYVYHERGGGTFHPKVYLLSDSTQAYLLVGSSNLTAGGLSRNNEAAVQFILDLTDSDDRHLFEQVNAWLDRMTSDPKPSKLLTDELLETLRLDPEYRIGDEDKPRQIESLPGNEFGGAPHEEGAPTFGPSAIPKRYFRRQVPSTRGTVGMFSPDAVGTSSPSTQVVAAPSIRWYKKLSASDAQQPKTSNSAPTGNLKLTRSRFDIDQTTYFRDVMFGDVLWAATETTPRGVKEEAIVPFDIIIDGRSMGNLNLKIDHASFRVADQGNVATWLHWGPLGAELREHNYTDAWVVIDRFEDGTFRLEITLQPPTS